MRSAKAQPVVTPADRDRVLSRWRRGPQNVDRSITIIADGSRAVLLAQPTSLFGYAPDLVEDIANLAAAAPKMLRALIGLVGNPAEWADVQLDQRHAEARAAICDAFGLPESAARGDGQSAIRNPQSEIAGGAQ
jgi:hypothetical protein